MDDSLARIHDLALLNDIGFTYMMLAILVPTAVAAIRLPSNPKAAARRNRLVRAMPWIVGMIAIPCAVASARLEYRITGEVGWVYLIAGFAGPPVFAWCLRYWETDPKAQAQLGDRGMRLHQMSRDRNRSL